MNTNYISFRPDFVNIDTNEKIKRRKHDADSFDNICNKFLERYNASNS